MNETIGTLLVLGGTVLFLIALFAYFWPLPKLKLGTKRAATLALALSVGTCISGTAFLPDPPRTVAKPSAEPEAKRQAQPKVDRKAIRVKEAKAQLKREAENGWNDLLATVRPCDDANSQLAAYLGKDGMPSMFAAFELADSAATTCTTTWLALNDLDAPRSAKGSLEDEFEEALETCQMAYFMRKRALEAAKEVFDGNMRPSTVNEAKREASAAQTGILSCVASYMSAAAKAGVKLEAFSGKGSR